MRVVISTEHILAIDETIGRFLIMHSVDGNEVGYFAFA